MKPRAALGALFLLVLAGGVGIAAARRAGPADILPSSAAAGSASSRLPVLASAAEVIEADGWLNSEALGPSDLAGRVVLYDFWTFGCINCRNTLPHVKAWHERYAPDGLVVLSIHTPEFDYERDPAAVRWFLDENGIDYPVALDPDKVVWRAFENRYWPAFYLHDRDGRRRYVHFGEGRYDDTEDAIRQLLGVELDAPRAEVGVS